MPIHLELTWGSILWGLQIPHFEGFKGREFWRNAVECWVEPSSPGKPKVWSDGIRVQIVWTFTSQMLRAWAKFFWSRRTSRVSKLRLMSYITGITGRDPQVQGLTASGFFGPFNWRYVFHNGLVSASIWESMREDPGNEVCFWGAT